MNLGKNKGHNSVALYEAQLTQVTFKQRSILLVNMLYSHDQTEPHANFPTITIPTEMHGLSNMDILRIMVNNLILNYVEEHGSLPGLIFICGTSPCFLEPQNRPPKKLPMHL